MKTTDLKIGDWVRIKMPSPQGERLSIPMQVVGLLSSFNNPSPKDTVYLDFEGNEGDVWEEEVQNLMKCNKNICMKGFNLEAAKAGKPVCTRDGRRVRILCFDRKGYPESPIMGLVDEGDRETFVSWRPDGSVRFSDDSYAGRDLMMATEESEDSHVSEVPIP